MVSFALAASALTRASSAAVTRIEGDDGGAGVDGLHLKALSQAIPNKPSAKDPKSTIISMFILKLLRIAGVWISRQRKRFTSTCIELDKGAACIRDHHRKVSDIGGLATNGLKVSYGSAAEQTLRRGTMAALNSFVS